MTVNGQVGANYALEATTNFTLWTGLATNPGPTFHFTNPPPSQPWRFFRARVAP